jgi:DNA-binding MarR family transcriptional regulator
MLRRKMDMEAKEKKVLDAMKKAGQPLRPGEIAEKAAMDKAEVTKIIDKLKKEGKVSSPKRCFYAPA